MAAVLICIAIAFFSYYDYGLVPTLIIMAAVLAGAAVIKSQDTKN